MSLELQPSDHPLSAMQHWYRQADEAFPSDEAHAMALATTCPEGWPSVRIVLCRDIDEMGRLFFYTNYRSRKARELEATGRAAAVFHWRDLGRQLRVEGTVERAPASQSDAYWNRRPRASRISALISPQSETIAEPDELERQRSQLDSVHRKGPLPRPTSWGGYVLLPHRIEFWQQGDARLHERLCFERRAGGSWAGRYLAP